jgi:SPP1 family predicted phage head-tail adaptor
MRAGALSERIVVQVASVARDAYGGQTRTWSDEATVWAQADPWQLRDRLAARRQMGDAAVSFLVRTPLTVSLGRRIAWAGAYYDIVEIDASRKGRGELLLICRAEDIAP